MAIPQRNKHHAGHNERGANAMPAWAVAATTALALLTVLTVPLTVAVPAGAASKVAPKGSVPAQWNTDPNASCGSWHQATPPSAGYVGTLKLSGGGGGVGGNDLEPPYSDPVPTGGQGGLVSTAVATEGGSTVSVFTACGGPSENDHTGGAGYGSGGSGGIANTDEQGGSKGGSGGGASILCLGSVTTASQCSQPLVIAGGGGGSGGGVGCNGAAFAGSGGTAGVDSTTSSNGWDVAAGQGGTDGSFIPDPPTPPTDPGYDGGSGGSGGSAAGGGSGGAGGQGDSGGSGSANFPGQSSGGGGGRAATSALTTASGGGGGGGGFTGGGGGGGDWCIETAALGGGGGGGSSAVNLDFTTSASFTSGAAGAVQNSTNSCSTGGDTQVGGCQGYVSLVWTPANDAPTITNMRPGSGSQTGGGTVTFTGTNLAPVSSVTFGNASAGTPSVDTPEKVVVTVPAESPLDYGDPTVGVNLSTAAGTASDSFTYTSSPSAPTITNMAPDFGPMAGARVTLTGTNLAGATRVGMGFTDSMKIVSDSATQIVAETPPENEGAYQVPVITPNGGTLSPTPFTVYGTPVVTTTSLPSGQVGQPYSATLAEKGGAPPVTWSIASGGTLQTGLSLNPTTGVISGTPTVAGWATLVYKAVDADALSGESGSLILKISALTTSTRFTIMPMSATYGAPVTFDATVTSPTGTPVGTVAFTAGQKPLCTASLGTGTDTGSCTITATTIGSNQSVTAAYSGDAEYSRSYASTGGFNVSKSATTTNVTATPSAASYGTRVSYAAQVVPPHSGTGIAAPTGQVVFTSGSSTLCTGSMSLGSAACTGNTPPPSPTAVVTATYSGDSNYNGSTGTTAMDVSKGQAQVTSSVFRPSVTYGGTETYYATATAPSTTPTGSVTFVTQGGITLCTTTLSGGSGSCTSNAAGPSGEILVYANYSGSADFAPITDSYSTRSLVYVAQALPIVRVGVDPILAIFGSPQTYTARLIGGGPLAPTGTATFSVDGTEQCSATLAGGSASCSPMIAPGGTGYTVLATYSGDDNYLGAHGQAITTVFAAPTATVAHASPNKTVFGQSVTYSAVVNSSKGVPAGTVSFTDGSTVLCAASLSAGRASCSSTSAPVAAAGVVTATYAGSADFATSSGTTPIDVVKATSATTASVNPVSTSYGSPVTYRASVTAQFAGTPTGTVTFSTGNGALCIAALSGGSASCSSANAPGGTDTISATYSGDVNFDESTGSTSLTVMQAATTAEASVHPVTVTYGYEVDYSATVNGPESAPVDGGTVQFTEGPEVLCTANVNGSKASCSSDQARPGLDLTISAGFGGTTDYAPTLATTTLNVVQAATKTSVKVTPQPAVYASPVTLAATVTAPPGQFPQGTTPTGSVRFSIGSLFLCTATISKGTGSCRATNAPVGAGQLVSAEYSGDEVYPPSTGTASLTVVAGPDRCSSTREGSASVPDGYWLAAANGAVYSCGDAGFHGSLVTLGIRPTHPIVGMAATPDGKGYWLVASDGGIFAFGDAVFYGSMGGKSLHRPIVGMAVSPQGGYYEVASDGGIFAFGPGAVFYGSEGGKHLNAPIVGMDVAKGGGYRLVAADGGIFAFGPGAHFYGSMGGRPLNKPIVGMATATEGGYWLVAADGGIFSFGPGAHFYGSMGGRPLNKPIVGMANSGTDGYWLVAADGGIFSFGSARFAGSTGGGGVTDIEGMAAS